MSPRSVFLHAAYAFLELAGVLGGVDEIPMNRTTGTGEIVPRRQYCNELIYQPYLEDLDEQLGARFASHHRQIYSLQYLVPVFFGELYRACLLCIRE